MPTSTIRRRMSIALRALFLLGVCGVFAVQATFFTVSEGEAVVVTRFGRPIRALVEAGPYFKLPYPIDEVHRLDVRNRSFTTPQIAALTRDKKNVVLTTFVVWRVAEPTRYLQAVGDATVAENQLSGLVAASKNRQLGQVDLSALVSLQPTEIRLAEIENEMQREVAAAVRESLGIEVAQIGIERITLPPENMTAVIERMRAERRAEANRIRSEGAKQAQAIRDDAHVQSQEILRVGREEAGRIFAEAERKAAELLAAAHAKSPEFFEFWSSLQAAKQSLQERSVLILRSDRLFFDALLKPPTTEVPQQRNSPTGGERPGVAESLAVPTP